MNELRLTAADKVNPLWLRIKAHYVERLNTLRLQNDFPMEPGARSFHIGQIMEVKHVLNLEDEPPYIPPPRPE